MNVAVLHHTTHFFSLGLPKKSFLGSGFPKSSAVSPWGHCVLPRGHLEPAVPYKGGSSSWGVEPCWALNGSHLSAPRAAGHSSAGPTLSGGIWQPCTLTFHIFHHLQQHEESGGPGCAAKQRDKGYFPKLCNPVLHK